MFSPKIFSPICVKEELVSMGVPRETEMTSQKTFLELTRTKFEMVALRFENNSFAL